MVGRGNYFKGRCCFMETEKSFEWLFHQISLNTDGVSLAEWKEMTGDGFSFFKDFLYATKKLADRIPCHLSDPYSGCKGMFIVGKYGYCSARYDRNGQKKVKSLIEPADDVEYYDYTDAYLEQETHCDVMTINPADLQCFDFDFKAFWKSAIENSPIWRDVSFNYGIRFMHQNGLYELGVCKIDKIKKYRLFFLLSWDEASLNTGIDYLNNRVEGKYALIVPSSFNKNIRQKINSISTGSVIINLDEILKYDDDDGFIHEKGVGETIIKLNEKVDQNLDNCFHYCNGTWQIKFKNKTFTFRHRLGFLLIALLLKYKRTSIPSLQLLQLSNFYGLAKPKKTKNEIDEIINRILEPCDAIDNDSIDDIYDFSSLPVEGTQFLTNPDSYSISPDDKKDALICIAKLNEGLVTIQKTIDLLNNKIHPDKSKLAALEIEKAQIQKEIKSLENIKCARDKATKNVSSNINRCIDEEIRPIYLALYKYLNDELEISSSLEFKQHNNRMIWDVILPTPQKPADK